MTARCLPQTSPGPFRRHSIQAFAAKHSQHGSPTSCPPGERNNARTPCQSARADSRGRQLPPPPQRSRRDRQSSQQQPRQQPRQQPAQQQHQGQPERQQQTAAGPAVQQQGQQRQPGRAPQCAPALRMPGPQPPPPQQNHQHQQPASPPPPRAQPDFLVVVEGLNDMRAVRRAVGAADVYVLGTSTVADNPQVLQELREAARRYPAVVVLTDPDVAGRQARQALDEGLPGCLHAFIPAPLATAAEATKYHEGGNVGVEHAAPQHIRAALAAPRRSGAQRQCFSRQRLQELGLVAEMHARGGDVTQRRNLVCAFLGIGTCDGKQLQRQLNRYGFSEEDVAAALRWAARQMAAAPAAGQAASVVPGPPASPGSHVQHPPAPLQTVGKKQQGVQQQQQQQQRRRRGPTPPPAAPAAGQGSNAADS